MTKSKNREEIWRLKGIIPTKTGEKKCGENWNKVSKIYETISIYTTRL